MTSSQSPPEIVEFVQTHGVEKEVKKCNTLNPLAPQFFPGNAEESSHFSGEKVKDDFLSSKFSAPIAVNMVPGENKQMKTVMADAHPVELKRVELQHSNTINESVKAHKLVGDPKCSLLLNSTCMTQPTQPVSIENLSSMEKSIVADGDVLGCSKETNDDMTKGSMRGSFRVKHHFPTPSSSYCQEGLVTSIFETLQGVPKSLIDSPKLDVQTMVNAMLILSELLVKSCVHTLDSYKNDHDRIQQIINNLNEFSSIYSGQMISAGQSVHPGNADLLGRSLDLPKLSRKGMEEANVETFAIPNKLLNQNDNGLNDVSEVIAEREQYSVTSSSDMGPQKGNEIFQVIRKNLGKNLDFEEHLDPQASLYRNLWLDAEAAMCHMRRKIYLRLIETGIDANHAELVDLWR